MSRTARIAETTADLHVVADIARAAFEIDEPAWATRCARLASARRSVATPWLLEEGRRPLSSLLAYPLSFGTPDGTVVRGFGLGAVATVPEGRGCGHASYLCQAVAEHNERQGRGLGLLFSAIRPGYYERLGYRAAPAWDFVTTRLGELAASGPRAAWHALDPRRSGEVLARLFDEAHRGTLHLARDGDAWRRTLEVEPLDWWLGLGPVDGGLRGYARVARQGAVLDLVELVLRDTADEGPALRGLAELALELRLQKLGCWLAPSETVEAWFEDRGREKSLPMVRGFDAIERSRFWSSDYF